MPDAKGRTAKMGARLFELADLITRYPGEYSAKRLADHFETSLRTIRRDIKLLEDMNIRVESKPGGGYFTAGDLSRLPVALSGPERIALEVMPWLMKSALAGVAMSTVVDAYLDAVDKIARRAGVSTVLKSMNSVDVSSIVADLYHVTGDSNPPAGEDSPVALGGDASPQANAAVIEIIYAITQNLRLLIEYQSMSGHEVTRRRVDPYYLVPWQNSLYVVGWCHLRSAFRTFKVTRMKSVTATEFCFTRRPDFSLADFLQEAWGIDQSGDAVDATLAFSEDVARYAREEMQSRRLLEESTDTRGRYLVTVRAQFNPEFLRFIMQYGAKVEVLGPESLRQAIIDEALVQVRMYGTKKEISL